MTVLEIADSGDGGEVSVILSLTPAELARLKARGDALARAIREAEQR